MLLVADSLVVAAVILCLAPRWSLISAFAILGLNIVFAPYYMLERYAGFYADRLRGGTSVDVASLHLAMSVARILH